MTRSDPRSGSRMPGTPVRGNSEDLPARADGGNEKEIGASTEAGANASAQHTTFPRKVGLATGTTPSRPGPVEGDPSGGRAIRSNSVGKSNFASLPARLAQCHEFSFVLFLRDGLTPGGHQLQDVSDR